MFRNGQKEIPNFRDREAPAARQLSASTFALDVARGMVWLDFSSIPQLCDVGPADSAEEQAGKQEAAIHSIPAYLERANYFWILAPSAEHVDKRERRDFQTYRQRAWTRFEECVNLLTNKSIMPLVVTELPFVASYSMGEMLPWLAGNVCSGPSL